MKQIKHIEADGSGAMMFRDLNGEYLLTLFVKGAILSTHRYYFNAECTLTEVLGEVDRLRNGINGVADGLRAQIEEESA